MWIKWPTWLLVPKRQQGLTEEPRPRPPQVSSSHPLTSLAQGRDSKPTSCLKDRLSLHFSYFDFLLRKLFHFYGEEGIEQKSKPWMLLLPNSECYHSPSYSLLLLGFGEMEGGSPNNLLENILQVRMACCHLGIKYWLLMSVLLSGFHQNQSNSSSSN